MFICYYFAVIFLMDLQASYGSVGFIRASLQIAGWIWFCCVTFILQPGATANLQEHPLLN